MANTDLQKRAFAAKTAEMRAMYRQAYLFECQSKDGLSEEEAESAYREHKAEMGLDQAKYAEMKRLTVDMVLDCGADWKELASRYLEVSKAPSKFSSEVVSELYSAVSEEATYRAYCGEFSDTNAQYMSDEDKSKILEMEHEASQDAWLEQD